MSAHRPRVSVVLNFLNAEGFLSEAVDSVLGQSFAGWELVFVDDGSTDTSSDIARGYAARNPSQIRYLEHPGHRNLGTSASRNLGWRAAEGSLVAFLDADDVWFPEKLAEQSAIMEARPEVAMLYGPKEWWHGWTGKPKDLARDMVTALGVDSDSLVRPPTLVAVFLRDQAAVPSPSGVLVRRSVLEEVGGFEEAFPGLYDDQVLYAKIALRAPVYVSGTLWYRYRQHPAQYCHHSAQGTEILFMRPMFLTWLARWLDRERLDYPEITSLIAAELRRYQHPLRYGLQCVWHFAGKVRGRVLRRDWRPSP